jgi:hypothetical protein
LALKVTLLAGLTTPFKLTLPELNQVLKMVEVMVLLQSLVASVGRVKCVNVHPITIINNKVVITISFFENLNFFMMCGFFRFFFGADKGLSG